MRCYTKRGLSVTKFQTRYVFLMQTLMKVCGKFRIFWGDKVVFLIKKKKKKKKKEKKKERKKKKKKKNTTGSLGYRSKF